MPIHARVRSNWILIGIVAGLTVLNGLFFWLADRDYTPHDWQFALTAGGWIFQPMLFAVWAALGPDRFAVRLPPLLASLLIVVATPACATAVDLSRREFIAMMAVGLVPFLVCTALLLAWRRITGLRIEPPGGSLNPSAGPGRLQFSIKYLITLTSLSAIVLGFVTSMQFAEPRPRWMFPDFFTYQILLLGAAISGSLLSVLAVPLLVLSAPVSRRFAAWSFAVWVTVTAISLPAWLAADAEYVVVALVFLFQVGAVTIAGLATLPLRLAGYRIAHRPTQHDGPPTNGLS